MNAASQILIVMKTGFVVLFEIVALIVQSFYIVVAQDFWRDRWFGGINGNLNLPGIGMYQQFGYNYQQPYYDRQPAAGAIYYPQVG